MRIQKLNIAQSINLLGRPVSSIATNQEYNMANGKITPVGLWEPGKDIVITYQNTSVEKYSVIDEYYWDIDYSLASLNKPVLTESDIIKEFYSTGILNEHDYKIIFGTLPSQLSELRRRILQYVSLPDPRYNEDSDSSRKSKIIRGYLSAIKLLDTAGITSLRRSVIPISSSNDEAIQFLKILNESNPIYLEEPSASLLELVDICRNVLITRGISKELIDSADNACDSCGPIKTLVKGIVLLFCSYSLIT
jgi:hypothetical protein